MTRRHAERGPVGLTLTLLLATLALSGCTRQPEKPPETAQLQDWWQECPALWAQLDRRDPYRFHDDWERQEQAIPVVNGQPCNFFTTGEGTIHFPMQNALGAYAAVALPNAYGRYDWAYWLGDGCICFTANGTGPAHVVVEKPMPDAGPGQDEPKARAGFRAARLPNGEVHVMWSYVYALPAGGVNAYPRTEHAWWSPNGTTGRETLAATSEFSVVERDLVEDVAVVNGTLFALLRRDRISAAVTATQPDGSYVLSTTAGAFSSRWVPSIGLLGLAPHDGQAWACGVRAGELVLLPLDDPAQVEVAAPARLLVPQCWLAWLADEPVILYGGWPLIGGSGAGTAPGTSGTGGDDTLRIAIRQEGTWTVHSTERDTWGDFTQDIATWNGDIFVVLSNNTGTNSGDPKDGMEIFRVDREADPWTFEKVWGNWGRDYWFIDLPTGLAMLSDVFENPPFAWNSWAIVELPSDLATHDPPR